MRKTGSVFLSSGKGMPQSHIQALFVCADFRFFCGPDIFFALLSEQLPEIIRWKNWRQTWRICIKPHMGKAL